MRPLALPLLAWRALRWNALSGGWFPRFVREHRPFRLEDLAPDSPVDIIVSVADHFEPARRSGVDAASRSVKSWLEAYRGLAGKHRDSDGLSPRHSWFYRSEYRNVDCVRSLAEAAFDGLGEIEFHLHHGHDTHQTFSARLREGLDFFNRIGAMLTAESCPRRRFAYIAGNWALDNGTGNEAHSGCNTELLALKDAGCYADFTFPALGSPSQPRKSNAIFYATDDPRPKSYDDGPSVRVGGRPEGDLLLFQGPLTVDWDAGRFEDCALESGNPPHPSRLRHWLSGNVHVEERPEWIFVKLHTHGMQSRDVILGPGMDAMWAEMVERWTRPPFRLHFATAREAYNMVKAAEAGRQGNPGEYRDFEIPPPANSRVACSADWRLQSYGDDALRLELIKPGPARIRFRSGPLREIEGVLASVDLAVRDGERERILIEGSGEVLIREQNGAERDLRVDGKAEAVLGSGR